MKILTLVCFTAFMLGLYQLAYVDDRVNALKSECEAKTMDVEMLPGESICDPAYFDNLEKLTPTQQQIKDMSDSRYIWFIVMGGAVLVFVLVALRGRLIF